MKTEHTEYTMKNLAAERDRLKAANAEMPEALKRVKELQTENQMLRDRLDQLIERVHHILLDYQHIRAMLLDDDGLCDSIKSLREFINVPTKMGDL